MASSIEPSPVWASDLSASGVYYDGILDQNQLGEVLELHKRDTMSMFGTRSSYRVSSEAKAVKGSKKAIMEEEKGMELFTKDISNSHPLLEQKLQNHMMEFSC